MLAAYIDAYIRQWHSLKEKGRLLETWIRDVFGDKSTELQAFRQRMETSPIERLVALCHALCAKHGYVPLDIYRSIQKGFLFRGHQNSLVKLIFYFDKTKKEVFLHVTIKKPTQRIHERLRF